MLHKEPLLVQLEPAEPPLSDSQLHLVKMR